MSKPKQLSHFTTVKIYEKEAKKRCVFKSDFKARRKSYMTSGCSKFLLRLPGKLGRQSYRAVLMVEPVLRSKMNAVVVDQGLEQRAVEHQPGRPAPVHRCTGTLVVVVMVAAVLVKLVKNIKVKVATVAEIKGKVLDT